MFRKYFNVHSNGEQKHGGESTLRIPDHAIGAGDLVQPTPRPDRIPNTQLDTSFRIVERDRNSIRRKARLNVSSPYFCSVVRATTIPQSNLTLATLPDRNPAGVKYGPLHFKKGGKTLCQTWFRQLDPRRRTLFTELY